MRSTVDGVESSVKGLGTSPRRLLLGVLAIITPAGLVLVNVAAYVMQNLAAFRLAITIGAVVSTVVLNALTGVTAYRLGLSRWADHWFFDRGRLNGLVAVFIFLLAMGAALAGVLTYQGLSDPRRLPNLSTFLAGLIGLSIPLVLAGLLRENVSRRQRRRYRTR